MATSTIPCLSLPDEVQAVIWRIFGNGESPRNALSTFDLIEPIIRKHISSSTMRYRAIAEIQDWFEPNGGRRTLKQNMQKPIAVLIVEGVGTDRSEKVIWAIGSIEVDLATHIIRSFWHSQDIDSFVEAAITTLEKLAKRDDILDAAGIIPFAGFDQNKAKIPRDIVQQEGKLKTYRHLNGFGFDLVHRALNPSVGNLIGMVVDLQPKRFQALIERLDHPVMQARAAYLMVSATRALDHRKPLTWITGNSCDALVALAIVHVLETVNRLDGDIRCSEQLHEDQCIWSTELRPPQDDLNAAAVNLLNDLVERLGMLNPHASARWIGELLSSASYMLEQGGDIEKPSRIQQLEETATALLVRHFCDSWSDDLLSALCDGLRTSGRITWTRHVARTAREVSCVEPKQAGTLARAALDELKRHVTEELERGQLFLIRSDWHDREWITELGAALALSSDELNLTDWVSTRCRALPLSVWDAEESRQTFRAADRAAQIWLLVALHAVASMKLIDRAVDPAEVRALAEIVWSHCHFTDLHLLDTCEASVAVECAARTVADFGEPSDVWLLEQARDQRVRPRALWALIDQQERRTTCEGGLDAGSDKMFICGFAEAASDRFGEGGRFDFESLHDWGQLWLLLGFVQQAHRTAKAIIAFPVREMDRRSKLLILKLLTLGADKQQLDIETWDYIWSTYRELWPIHGYAPYAERACRQQIDKLIKCSEVSVRRGSPARNGGRA